MENITPQIQQALFKLEAIRQSTDDKLVKKAILDCEELLTAAPPPQKLWRSSWIQHVFLALVALLLLVTIYVLTDCFTLNLNNQSTTKIPYKVKDLIIYGLWIIGPPIFFLIEYTYIFGKDEQNRLNSAQRDDIKYCQDLGAKIWAAVAVFISILLTIKYGSPFK